jgi:hypothetical protein
MDGYFYSTTGRVLSSTPNIIKGSIGVQGDIRANMAKTLGREWF